GSLPLDGAGLSMPEVTVSGLDKVTYWLAINGLELHGEGAIGLQADALPAAALTGGTSAAERLRRTGGPSWKVIAPEWRLGLVQRSRPTEARPTHVFLADQTAAVVDGQHWLHETVLWLQHEANTD